MEIAVLGRYVNNRVIYTICQSPIREIIRQLLYTIEPSCLVLMSDNCKTLSLSTTVHPGVISHFNGSKGAQKQMLISDVNLVVD